MSEKDRYRNSESGYDVQYHVTPNKAYRDFKNVDYAQEIPTEPIFNYKEDAWYIQKLLEEQAYLFFPRVFYHKLSEDTLVDPMYLDAADSNISTWLDDNRDKVKWTPPVLVPCLYKFDNEVTRNLTRYSKDYEYDIEVFMPKTLMDNLGLIPSSGDKISITYDGGGPFGDDFIVMEPKPDGFIFNTGRFVVWKSIVKAYRRSSIKDRELNSKFFEGLAKLEERYEEITKIQNVKTFAWGDDSLFGDQVVIEAGQCEIRTETTEEEGTS